MCHGSTSHEVPSVLVVLVLDGVAGPEGEALAAAVAVLLLLIPDLFLTVLLAAASAPTEVLECSESDALLMLLLLRVSMTGALFLRRTCAKLLLLCLPWLVAVLEGGAESIPAACFCC